LKRGLLALVTLAAFATLAGLVACGSKAPLPKTIGAAASAAPTPLPTSAVEPRKDKSPPGAEAHALFPVPDGSIGPFLARRGDVVLGAYVGASSEGTRRVVSVPLSADGEARGDAKVVAPVATDATMLAVRATGGPKPGFVAAWTALGGDRGEILNAVGISDDGRPRGVPSELARTTEDIVWLDVVPTTRGALVLWAEQTKDGDANLLAAALAPDGALRGLPARIARGVRSWQAVAAPDGVGLALASTLSATKTSLVWERVDADAHAKGTVTLAPGTRLAGDVDAVRVGDETLLAWTDATQPDPAPTLAAVDDAGHVRGPKRAIEGGAGGTLVGLASGPAGAVVAWEEPFRRGRASKRVLIGKVDVKGLAVDAAAVAPLDLQGNGAPELAALSSGFALLAPTLACAADASCEGAPVLPTFVRFDANLGVVQVVPFRLGVLRQQASTGWSLSCAIDDCLALAVAADETGTPRVSAVSLRPRPNAFRAPIAPAPPADAPVVQALDTVAAGQPFADLATARAGAGTVAALLAAANDETKRDDVAVIELHAFDERGAATATAVVTRRALAAGGVAIATTDREADGAAIAWIGRDAGDPQVHVTRMDLHGKLLRDVQLTTAKGDASDVAIAWAGDAEGAQAHWVVAWVDARDGNGEVYATTLDRDGRTIGRGQRITNAPGDASDVALLATGGGGNVWLAWADPRESPQDGFADIYAAQLRPQDATRVGSEARVLATAAHSRSPALGARGKDVGVAWIEEAPTGADPTTARAYGAMLAWLGPGGQPASEPRRLPTVGSGFPTAVALDGTTAGVLHVVLARAEDDLLSLDGIDLTRDPGSPYPLVTLDGPSSLDVAIGLTSTWLFWTDESADATARRVRRATVRWTR
jgi:hypothetical protein